ncbi:MAG: hypothetical protein JO019_00980 [Candidatus Kaiserbacteria bacterium]|nr:hypothetical protein [Candidatus Kaiserbacteria bacterium]
MRESIRPVERLKAALPKITMPNALVLAFVSGLAAAGNATAAKAEGFVKKTIDGAVHDCVEISRDYPKGTEKPGIYFFPGGTTYYSKGHVEPPMFVVVTGHPLPEGAVPFSITATPNDLKDAFEIDGQMCAPEQKPPEPGALNQDLPPLRGQLPPLQGLPNDGMPEGQTPKGELPPLTLPPRPVERNPDIPMS